MNKLKAKLIEQRGNQLLLEVQDEGEATAGRKQAENGKVFRDYGAKNFYPAKKVPKFKEGSLFRLIYRANVYAG